MELWGVEPQSSERQPRLFYRLNYSPISNIQWFSNYTTIPTELQIIETIV